MKNMGDMRREIKRLSARQDKIEAQLAAVIDTFCKDTFDDATPPFDLSDLEITDEDLP